MPSDLVPELALIPGGEFLMGSEDADEDERPAHRVQVDDFFLALQPVTHADYARFVRGTGHRAPAMYELPLVVTTGGPERERTFSRAAAPYVWSQGLPPQDRVDHPVTLVRYEDAAAYCAWLAAQTGKPFRLPTEAEWEKAARGGAESKRYPWGDRLDRNMANFLVDPAKARSRFRAEERMRGRMCQLAYSCGFVDRLVRPMDTTTGLLRPCACWS